MKLYRISRAEYIKDLSGTGAKLYGGRWNEKGTPLIYSSENVSLGILEVLVHFDGLTVPNDLKLLSLQLPDSELEQFSQSKFKKMRKAKYAELQFKRAGQKWITSNKSLGLQVPSIITQGENNILINPRHPHISKLEIINVENLELVGRLFM